jgi:serine/threonine-protein kinase
MLDRRGVVKVMDFGIARYVGASRITRAGSTVGTAHYMAPEQVRGVETDARSDIYSLCIVLYEMLTDRLPFDAEVEYEVMRAHVELEPTPPREIRPEIPEAVEAAVLRGLAKDPEQRFASTEELRAALVAALGATPRVSAVELGELAARGTRKDAPASADTDSDTRARTELLLTDPADTPVPLAAARYVTGTRSTPPSNGGSSTVWELPDTGRHTQPQHVAEPRAQAGRAEQAAPRRILRSALQIAVMALVALSVGVPNAIERPEPPPADFPPGASARLQSGPLLDAPSVELVPLWLPPTLILPEEEPEPAKEPEPRVELVAEPEPAPRPQPAQAAPRPPAAPARSRPTPPRPKPASIPQKAPLVRADEEPKPRHFNEGAETAEPRTSEWLLRR